MADTIDTATIGVPSAKYKVGTQSHGWARFFIVFDMGNVFLVSLRVLNFRNALAASTLRAKMPPAIKPQLGPNWQ
jgi:hypothetical protein